MTMLAPGYIESHQFAGTLKARGYSVLNAGKLTSFIRHPLAELESLQPDRDNLPLDNFLKNSGRYRRRRHSCFIVNHQSLTRVPRRAHYQSTAYKSLHGGMHRLFEPIAQHTVQQPAWKALMFAISGICPTIRGEQPWHIEAHQFRINTRNGIGRPTPEGAHRNGVDFVAILLVSRNHASCGETRIFKLEGPNGQRFTLSPHWTLLLLDDQRVIHESTPIQPTAENAYPDTLLLTSRAGAFLKKT